MPSSTKTSPRQRTAGRKRTGAAREKPQKSTAPVAQNLKPIDPDTDDPQERFALHLRDILRRKGWSAEEFAQRCQTEGVQVNTRAVYAWMRGDRMPRAHELLQVGRAAGLKDPRHILPPDKK